MLTIHGKQADGGIQDAWFTCFMTKTASPISRRILVVDDDESARESISLLLGIDRHTVVQATDGAEALQRFTEEPFDLVITDYFMPGMRGDELTVNIRHLAPAQPVLMVTAYLEKLVETGELTDAILGKPFGIEDLRRAITRQIGAAVECPTFGHQRIRHRASARTKVLTDILEGDTTRFYSVPGRPGRCQ